MFIQRKLSAKDMLSNNLGFRLKVSGWYNTKFIVDYDIFHFRILWACVIIVFGGKILFIKSEEYLITLCMISRYAGLYVNFDIICMICFILGMKVNNL